MLSNKGVCPHNDEERSLGEMCWMCSTLRDLQMALTHSLCGSFCRMETELWEESPSGCCSSLWRYIQMVVDTHTVYWY